MNKIKHKLLTSASAFKRKVKSLRDDTQGIAAIEFALLAPIMFGIYFGITIISLTIAANRDVVHATGVVSDLTTRFDVVDSATAENILTAAIAILGVSKSDIDNGRVTIEINSYRARSGTGTAAVPTVAERIGYARLGPSLGNDYDVDSVNRRLLNENSGVVVARIAQEFQTFGSDTDSSSGNWTLDKITLSDTVLQLPRGQNFVSFGDGSVDGAGSRFVNCTVSSALVVSC